MAQVQTRKDVWKLAEWDPILLWYAKAVAHLWTKPIKEPLSWRYQAAIHEYRRDLDPLASPDDQLPTVNQQKRFWNQCQHGSWFFLPWHRMYLSCFERIIRKTIKSLGGPDNWALPYWNYSDSTNPNARKLPPAFRAAKLPDGSPNRLRVAARASIANNGGILANENDVDIRPCLKEIIFTPQPAGIASFGGPRTGFHHPAGPAGTLERVPHGSIHNRVGGGLWMSGFNTAALDPIFWLHHCNLDRLWEVWRKRNPQNVNPLDSAWLTDLPFELHDETGAAVSTTPSQVTDSTAAPLLYEYQDVSDPLGGIPGPLGGPVIPAGLEEIEMSEMVGATEQPVTLHGEAVTTALAVNEPTGPAAIAAGLDTPQRRIFLNIENITAQGYSGGYEVYLNLPPGEKPSDHPDLFAGLLPMFGAVEAADPTGEHPSSGLQYSLEITDVAQTLLNKNAWDPSEMRVTFVPDRTAGELESEVLTAPVKVGRVSLYYE
jgi:tyrosinase